MSIILGIDPGTTTTGYALIKKENRKPILLDYGIIETTPKIPLEEKLFELGADFKSILEKYSPDLAVVEKLYFTNNIKTGIDVSHARGVIVYKLKKKNINILHHTPLELKSAICGNGNAPKRQLQNAIKILFGLDQIPKPDDAADAIGLAYMGFLNKKL
ncbi:MAG: crossover junction endodeoxyribonuclease RuvC [Candidatus Gracilibacteria bacterium]|nr:crossover junction endodeoxyribonuclease RuvC [Candidatus Gracilibacteria bacterium]